MFLASWSGSLCIHQFWALGEEVAVSGQVALQLAVQRSALLCKPEAGGEQTSLLTIDSSRLTDSYVGCFIHWGTWAAALQISLSTYFLFQLLELPNHRWSSPFLNPAILGLLVMVAATLVNSATACAARPLQKQLQDRRDRRTNWLSDSLTGLLAFRVQGWTRLMLARLLWLREVEQEPLIRTQLLWAANSSLSSFVPLLLATGTFTAVAAQQGSLSAPLAFTAMMWFNQLKGPISMIPFTLAGIVQTSVSFKRLAELFGSAVEAPKPAAPAAGRERTRSSRADSLPGSLGSSPNSSPSPRVVLRDLRFEWPAPAGGAGAEEEPAQEGPLGSPPALGRAVSDSSTSSGHARHNGRRVVLQDIDLEFSPGLHLIMGRNGSGKSTLLRLVVGALQPTSGAVLLTGGTPARPPLGSGHAAPIIGRHRVRSGASGVSLPAAAGAHRRRRSSSHHHPRAACRPTMAYAPQEPFIENRSIAKTVAFASSGQVDFEAVRRALRRCSMLAEVEQMPQGLATKAGAQGGRMSGGQRQRLGLARCLYAGAQVQVLDAPLSALDAHVASHVIERAILPLPSPDTPRAPSGRVVLMATNRIELASMSGVSSITLLSPDGRVAAKGAADAVCQSAAWQEFCHSMEVAAPAARARGSSLGLQRRASNGSSYLGGVASGLLADPPDDESVVSDGSDGTSDEDGAGGSFVSASTPPPAAEEVDLLGGAAGSLDLDDGGADAPLGRLGAGLSRGTSSRGGAAGGGGEDDDGDDDRGRGALKPAVLREYLRGCSCSTLLLVVTGFVLTEAFTLLQPWWLVCWTSGSDGGGDDDGGDGGQQQLACPSVGSWGLQQPWAPYAIVYGSLALAGALMFALRALTMAVGAVQAGGRLFRLAVTAVLHVPASFLDRNAPSRIQNRLVADQKDLDTTLAPALTAVANQSLRFLGVLITMAINTPWSVLAFVVLGYPYIWLAKRFRVAGREVRRLVSSTRAPLLASFKESVEGREVINAFDGAADAVLRRSAKHIARNASAYLVKVYLMQWITVWLEQLGNIVILVTIVLVVFSDHLSSSTAGWVLSFVLQLPNMLMWLTRRYAQLELDLVAAERLTQLAGQQHEEAEAITALAEAPVDHRRRSSSAAPSAARTLALPSGSLTSPAGAIPIAIGHAPVALPVVLDHVVLRYHSSRGPVTALDDVSLQIAAGEKVAIVGRTGSGKTSLLRALLRLHPHSQGAIWVGDTNISKEPVEATRSRMVALLQSDGSLFRASLRANLLGPRHIASGTDVAPATLTTTACCAGAGCCCCCCCTNADLRLVRSADAAGVGQRFLRRAEELSRSHVEQSLLALAGQLGLQEEPIAGAGPAQPLLATGGHPAPAVRVALRRSARQVLLPTPAVAAFCRRDAELVGALKRLDLHRKVGAAAISQGIGRSGHGGSASTSGAAAPASTAAAATAASTAAAAAGELAAASLREQQLISQILRPTQPSGEVPALGAEVLGDAGMKFSAGEQQLLLLCRSLSLRTGEVGLIVADEATAQLDDKADRTVHDRLLNHRATVLFVCHRLRHIQRFDRVVVMDKGRVAEVGDPGLLLQDSNSILTKLHRAWENGGGGL